MNKNKTWIFTLFCAAVLLLFFLNRNDPRESENSSGDGASSKQVDDPGVKQGAPLANPHEHSVVTQSASGEREVDLVLAPLDHSSLVRKAGKRNKRDNHLFAVSRPVRVAPHTDGDWRVEGDRARWDFSLQSEGARSLNLAFTEFHLPTGATLTISDPTGSSLPMTFTSQDNDNHGQLWTPIFLTEKLNIALDMPHQLASNLRLNLTKINHGFRSPSRQKSGKESKNIGDSLSGDCNVDIICNAENDPNFGPLVDQFRDQIRAVAAYTVGGIETCSGALINNTASNQRPYFLTAHHCQVRSTNASSVVVYWNFQHSVCRNPGSTESGDSGDGLLTEFNSGAIFRASRAESDFCLIELDDPVNAAYEPFYAGWDRTGVNPPFTVGIHHPAVAEKRISFELNATTTTAGYSDLPNSSGTHVRVADWDYGTTQPGSSGSSLFSNTGLIIGQLDGGFAACGNDEPDWYGRISRSWADGGSSASRLSNWLDPTGSNVGQLEGVDGDEYLVVQGASVLEADTGSSVLQASVILSRPAPDTVTVTVTSQDGSASVSGGDYAFVNTQLTFAPGETERSFPITINGDLSPEEHETFTLVLSGASNAAIGVSTAEIIILNNDYVAPSINSPLSESAPERSAFEYQITALNTPTSFSITDAPEGMSVDSITGLISWNASSPGNYTVAITATNPAGSQTRTLTIRVQPNLLVDALDLDSAGLSFSTATAEWFRQTSISYDGEDSARSIDIGDSESAEMSATVQGPDRMTFRWRVSSEESFDGLLFLMDGRLVRGVSFISGERDWALVSVEIPPGLHTVSWRYFKDGSVTDGSDAGWVDDIRLASGEKPMIWSVDEYYALNSSPVRVPVEFINATSSSFPSLPSWLSYDQANRQLIGTPPGSNDYSVTAAASNAVGSEITNVTIRVISRVASLSNALDEPDSIVTTPSSSPWFASSTPSAVGGSSVRSGFVRDNEVSSMILYVQGPGELSFRWTVSSEAVYDTLGYSINGSGEFQISGEVGWQTVRVPLAGGVNRIVWSYRKDGSESSGSDLGRVDNINLDGYAAFINESTALGFLSLPTDDSDLDGRSLFQEFAFGGSPTVADYSPGLSMAPAPGKPGAFQFEFTGPNNSAGIEYQLEESTNLEPGSWRLVRVFPDVVPAGEVSVYRYLGVQPQPENGKCFYRIRAVSK